MGGGVGVVNGGGGDGSVVCVGVVVDSGIRHIPNRSNQLCGGGGGSMVVVSHVGAGVVVRGGSCNSGILHTILN